jgi:hypothetical protein
VSEQPLWNWRDEGFLTQPIALPVLSGVVVYRVWGGTATETGSPTRPGVCFSFEKSTTRRKAEGLLAVWEWGNACRFVTTFEILPGATIFIGRVHPGDFYQSGLGAPGSQIFVEAFQVKQFVRQIGQAQKLLDDVGSHVIVPNRDPGKPRSS